MRDNIFLHSSLASHNDLQELCKPLRLFNIDYFSHVIINEQSQFSALCSNAAFTRHYLQNKYYDADINAAKNSLGEFVVWDNIDKAGLSERLYTEGLEFGVNHTFSLIRQINNEKHFFHFASSQQSVSINQVYLSNLELLKKFTDYVLEQIQSSKTLQATHAIKFETDEKSAGFTAKDGELITQQDLKSEFLQAIGFNATTPVDLTNQQLRCVELLAKGTPTKVIADKLKLSTRTVEHYLVHVRKKLSCRNNMELIALFLTHKWQFSL